MASDLEGQNQLDVQKELEQEAQKVTDKLLKEDPSLEHPRLYKKIPVMEIFGPTIQGEGMLIGNPTMFLRTGLCDYKCKRCDSLHAVLPDSVLEKAMWLSQSEIVVLLNNVLTGLSTPMITLSGGNPAIHDLSALMLANKLSLLGQVTRYFAIETQGTIWHDWILDCTWVTVSPKGPGMGEKFEPDKFGSFLKNLELLPSKMWCVKIPVFDQRDLELAVEIRMSWPQTHGRLYLSVGNVDPPAPALQDHPDEPPTLDEFRGEVMKNYEIILREVMQDRRLVGVSVLPQLHTLVWGNAACR